MKAINLLGTLAGVADNVVQLANKAGNIKEVALDAVAGAVVVQAQTPEAKDRILASVKHLEGTGTLGDALAAHISHLPKKHVAAVLVFAEKLTAAFENDGKADPMEVADMVMSTLKELA